MKKNTFAIYTMGCKLNFSESSYLSQKLVERGWHIGNEPEFIIVNTCAVTGSAEKKERNLVSKLHREYPESKVLLVGCYTALQPDVAATWQGVAKVFGSRDKLSVVDFITGQQAANAPLFFPAFSLHDRTRSFIKIQDGCDYHCAYCTVATARGESRSDCIENVLGNIAEIVNNGLKEVNLTGVNVGTFGKGTTENLLQLLQAVEKQNLIQRVRLSSIEPNLLTDEIIEWAARTDCMMPHFHIPLQSGCDKVLTAMRRRYQRALFADKITLIKSLMPDACIASDVIAGFPGETDEDFEDTYTFLQQLPVSYLHVFTFSRRPNTPAFFMDNQVPEPVKRCRTNRLLELSLRKKHAFYAHHFGTSRKVLWEADENKGLMFGFTDNYIKVKTPFSDHLVNTIQPVMLSADNTVID